MPESELPARTGEALPAEAKDEPTVAAALVTSSTVTKAISAGNSHSLALRKDGSVWAWGLNSDGQLGNGTLTLSKVPVRVTGLPAIKAIAAGRNHSLALGVDGKVWAWGQNSSGQLGDGTTTGRPTPVSVTIPGGAVAIAGGLTHSLAIAADGSVYTWGSNTYGQLGDGTTTPSRLTPVRISLPVSITAISAGWHHSMALGADGRVWTWGRNANGQIGNGSLVNQLLPYQVSLARGATAIAAGANHALVLLSDKSVVAWGQNTNGQLGNGTTATAQSTPVAVGLTAAVTAIATGSNFSLAIDSTGAAWAWGQNNNGQLGNGTMEAQRTSPVRVQGLNDALAVSAGLFHTLALRPGCPFWAWGLNSSGQLGDGTQTNQLTMTQTQLLNIYFYDLEGDGYGADLLSPVEGCEPPGTDYVENDLDCDDFDFAINPEATEVCDGLDNNCNDQTDEEGGLTTWYRDSDGDGRGSPSVIKSACSAPAGYVSNSDDCDDSTNTLPRYFHRDSDGDGYGDNGFVVGPTPTPSSPVLGCTQPSGYVSNSNDCDDTNASVNPGAAEVCNRVDDNCNGPVDEVCTCSAWFSSATVPSGGTATFGFTASGPFPAGSRSYLHGTRNGVVDANGSPSYDQTTFSFLVLNSPGLEGKYERYVIIRGPNNVELCRTNTVSAWFLYP